MIFPCLCLVICLLSDTLSPIRKSIILDKASGSGSVRQIFVSDDGARIVYTTECQNISADDAAFGPDSQLLLRDLNASGGSRVIGNVRGETNVCFVNQQAILFSSESNTIIFDGTNTRSVQQCPWEMARAVPSPSSDELFIAFEKPRLSTIIGSTPGTIIRVRTNEFIAAPKSATRIWDRDFGSVARIRLSDTGNELATVTMVPRLPSPDRFPDSQYNYGVLVIRSDNAKTIWRSDLPEDTFAIKSILAVAPDGVSILASLSKEGKQAPVVLHCEPKGVRERRPISYEVVDGAAHRIVIRAKSGGLAVLDLCDKTEIMIPGTSDSNAKAGISRNGRFVVIASDSARKVTINVLVATASR